MKLINWISFCLVFLAQAGGSAQDQLTPATTQKQLTSTDKTNASNPVSAVTNNEVHPLPANSAVNTSATSTGTIVKSSTNSLPPEVAITGPTSDDMSPQSNVKSQSENLTKYFDENTPRSKIDLEFDAIEGATKYQIEFKIEAHNFSEVYTSIKTEFHLRMPVARYQVRARAADDRGVFSDWSDPMEVTVSPEAVKFPTNTYFHKKPNPEDLDTSVLVHWQASEQANSYEVIIKKENNEIYDTIKVRENEVKLKLPPGKFRIQVVAVGPDDIKNTEPPFEPEILVEKAKLKTPAFVVNPDDPNDVSLHKMDIGDVNSRLEYQPWMSDEWYFVEEQFKINANAFVPTKKLKPGQYRLFVWLSGDGFEDSDETFRDFVIKPKEQDLIY